MANNILYEATLTNHTPAMIGGANRGWINIDGSIDYPRPTDIAGKTRWWLRSIISAGFYEEYNAGLPIYKLDEKAGEIMGQIKPIGRAEASKIIIELVPEDYEEYRNQLLLLKTKYRNQLCGLAHRQGLIDKPKWHRINRYCLEKLLENNGECPEGEEACCALASPRVMLTVMDKTVEEAVGLLPIPPGELKLKIRIRRRLGVKLNEQEERLIGLALGLALYASGIGKAQTRGYGKLSIVNRNHNYSSIVGDTLDEVSRLLDNCPNAFDTIANLSVEYAREYLSSSTGFQLQYKYQSREPLAYTLHTKLIKIWSNKYVALGNRDNRIYCHANMPWCIVAAISKATLKASLKKAISLSEKHPAPVPITITYGLPRTKDRHGYLGRINRLMSFVTYTSSKELLHSILFHKLSSDYEDALLKLNWRSGKYKYIRSQNIRAILDILFCTIYRNKSMECHGKMRQSYEKYSDKIKNIININEIGTIDVYTLNYINAVIVNEDILGLRRIDVDS